MAAAPPGQRSSAHATASRPNAIHLIARAGLEDRQEIGGDAPAQPVCGEGTRHDAESGRQRPQHGERPLHVATLAEIERPAFPSALHVDTGRSGGPSGGLTAAAHRACAGAGPAIDDALSVSPRYDPSAIELQ